MFKLLRPCFKVRNVVSQIPFFKENYKNSLRYVYLAGAGNETFTEEDILEALNPKKTPSYDKVPDFIKNSLKAAKTKNIDKKQKNQDTVIVCKNSNLNHYKNQKYDEWHPMILASKGWHHYKSKGDYFKIKVCNDKEYIDNLFWDETQDDFSSFKLNPDLIDALAHCGFKKPTKIQGKVIGEVLSGRNSLITAETGCGKTLAYLIPVINQILEWISHLPADRNPNQPLAIILAPSRDLAQQISEVAIKLSHLLPFRCNLLVGGKMKKRMLNPEFDFFELQISTPGALTKLVSNGLYDLSQVKHVVLDEGDTMLDDSYNETLVRLLRKIKIRYSPSPHQKLPVNSQITIVSATLPRNIYEILGEIVDKDSLNEIKTERTHHILPHVTQIFYRLGSSEKQEKLLKIVSEALQNNKKIIIFSNKVKTCDWLSLMLNENGISTVQLNGKMPEELRRGKFKEFQDGEVKVLSCTDIASRGLDTVQVGHIINYEFPKFMADYVHRCGRTGRIGSHHDSVVSNFITTDNDIKLVQKIETAARNMSALPNVNGNISKIIHDRFLKNNPSV